MKKQKFLAPLAVPAVLFAGGLLSNNTFADTALPDGFDDQNFYDCIVENYRGYFPDDTIDADGLTDTQLAKINLLFCYGADKDDAEKISSVKGLEKMPNLEQLGVPENKIYTLDVKQNKKLNFLDVRNNKLTTLRLEENLKIETLYVGGNTVSVYLNPENNVKTIDFSMKEADPSMAGTIQFDLPMKKVENFNAVNMGLQSINLSTFSSVQVLRLKGNSLETIDLKNSPKLKHLDLTQNNIEELDITANPDIETLLIDNINVKAGITKVSEKEEEISEDEQAPGSAGEDDEESADEETDGDTPGSEESEDEDGEGKGSEGATRYIAVWDLSKLKFLDLGGTQSIPESADYSFDLETKQLTVANKELEFVTINSEEEGKAYKLLLQGEEIKPDEDGDDEEEEEEEESDIEVPDTGSLSEADKGGALGLFAGTSFVALLALGAVIAAKKRASGHFKYDK